jgi:outer membrane protein insertion porin family
VIALRGILERDLRNDRRWPTQGYVISGGPEVGYASGTLIKLMHNFQYYRSLSKDQDWVYAYAHNVGVMPFDSDKIGISERFFMGGTSSLRGFAPRGAGPKDRGARKVAVGGATLLTQRHELRHRFSRTVQGRVFADIGLLDRDAFQLGKPRLGSGVGVTFNLGALVLELDLAAALVKHDRDRTRFLHFNLRSNY